MNLGPTEIILILLALVLLFGAKKLPDLARGVGRSLRIFKAETSKLSEDPDEDVKTYTVQQQPQPLQATPVLSPEEQARKLEEEAARLRASAQADKKA
ncbi:Sec-independent protein translocase subunit TatA [Nonomuraea sp. NPDC050663]|uniref:Sec-independent protein translocase protein TatA n=1 Tax=Nonomuraea soli TaxID=1032476 RepID=A0A7W0CS54_9ACTN|nr:Sec-independent protein translocase subunit TatA [Nonomuraea soli]MBA2896326.1 sec-independent protein translocase protein TatA [Nonomuraea soli]